jgi:hypothetical protein
MNRAILRSAQLILAATPALVPLVIILKFGVDFPYLDQWDPHIAGLFIKAHQGQLSIFDFLAQHNEHRIVVPRLVFFVLGSLTHWNTIAEMIFGWLLACASSVGILWLCGQQDDRGFRLNERSIAIWFVCNLLIFSPAQWENWLWGIGIVNLMSCFCIVAAVVSARSRLRFGWRFGLTMLCAVAAQYSCGNGLLCWPLAGIVLFWPEPADGIKIRTALLAVWVVGFALCTGLYFVGYKQPVTAQGQKASVPTAGAVVHYLAAFLGGPLSDSNPYAPLATATWVGGILLVLLLLVIAGFILASRNRELRGRMLPWLALAGFAVLSGAIAAAFRAAQGADKALVSRYVTTSIYLPLALINLIPMLLSDLQRRLRPSAASGARFLFQLPGIVLLVAWVVVQVMALPRNFDWWVESRADHEDWKSGIMLASQLPDDNAVSMVAGSTYHDLMANAEALDAMGYLRPGLIKTNDVDLIRGPDPAESVGRIEELLYDRQNGMARARGWAIKPDTVEPAHNVVFAYLDDRGRQIMFALSTQHQARTDIEAQKGRREYRLAGWVAYFPLSAIPDRYKPARITGWAFDAETGKAVKLLGEPIVPR